MGGKSKSIGRTVAGAPANWTRPAVIDGAAEYGADINRFFVETGSNEFDKRLVAFADKRGISIQGPGWRDEVLRFAALDHPEIREPKKRGAPRKPKPTGNNLLDLLAGVNQDQEATQIIEWLDEANRERLRANKRAWSDRAFLKCLLKQGGYSEDDPNGLLDSKLQVMANRVSKARKSSGKKPLKNG